jgi:YhcH/YjgK/YiaL family protein
MILDSIDRCYLYAGFGPLFVKAFDFLTKGDVSKLEPGKHIIDGEDLFVIFMEYDTKELSECAMENHKKYTDIQYIVDGVELIGITTWNGQQPAVPYDESKEAAFYDIEHDSILKLQKGQFAIFFPHDLHRPCIKDGEISRVKKLVFKVRVD